LKNKPHRYWLYLAAVSAIFLIRLLPRRFALLLAAAFGSLSFDLVSRQREKALSHLRFAYGGEKSEEEIRKIARACFVNCAKSAADWVLYPRFNRNNWNSVVRRDGIFERVDQILAKGKGIIMLTGHFGNWEMLASTFTTFGYPGAVVGRKIYYEPFNRLIVNTRLSKGVKTFYRDESPRDMLKAIKANQILGIVADQDVDSIEGIFVPFFGHLAYTPAAPAKLSIATGAPIVPAFTVREADDNYRIYMEEPIFPDPSAEREEEVLRITRLWNAQIEKYVRRYPQQWVWMHRRWKTRPPEEKQSGEKEFSAQSGQERK